VKEPRRLARNEGSLGRDEKGDAAGFPRVRVSRLACISRKFSLRSIIAGNARATTGRPVAKNYLQQVVKSGLNVRCKRRKR